jgi:hypothetical protein
MRSLRLVLRPARCILDWVLSRCPARRTLRLGMVWLVLCAAGLVQPCQTAAQNVSIRDVPLYPWTGFARSWDWSYDALHKLVVAGLTGPVVFNTKPMSRREMALILAGVLRRLDRHEIPDLVFRSDLQETLDELVVELSPELLALGLTEFEIAGEVPRWLEVKPLDYVEARVGYASNAATHLENQNGERLAQGWNGRLATSSWAEAGGHAALYLHPELALDTDDQSGRLVEGYAKARLGFAELLVGREAIWWGPGFHGSMLFSNNAPPVDMVRLQTGEQVTLPWLFRYLGPLKAQVFFGQLEREREFPRSKLAGARLDLAPTTWLELGVARAIMFDGEGRPKPPVWQWPALIFYTSDNNSSKYSGNTLFQADATLRLADVGRYVPITRDAELYVDVGVDDTCCQTAFIPLKPGVTVGLYLPNLFRSSATTLVVEYSNSSTFQFRHATWRTGFSRKGDVLSHFEGTGGEDFFVRLTHRPIGTVEVGLEFDMARVGQVTIPGSSRKERHNDVGLDISYQYSADFSFQLAGRVEWVKNRDFLAGEGDVNLIGLLTATYNFGQSYGVGPRKSGPAGPGH